MFTSHQVLSMHLYTLAQKLRNKCPLLLVLNLFNLSYLSVSLLFHLGTNVWYNLKPLKVLHFSCWLLTNISSILDFAKVWLLTVVGKELELSSNLKLPCILSCMDWWEFINFWLAINYSVDYGSFAQTLKVHSLSS